MALRSKQGYITRSYKSPGHAIQTRGLGVTKPLRFQTLASDNCFIVSHDR